MQIIYHPFYHCAEERNITPCLCRIGEVAIRNYCFSSQTSCDSGYAKKNEKLLSQEYGLVHPVTFEMIRDKHFFFSKSSHK
jgi:hypothetical protein